jgi:hypothetical protein
MPVIEPYFDPSFDLGTPFIVSYWAAFLGERSAMNKMIMKQRLQQMDPTERFKLQRQISEDIGKLEERKARIIQSDMEARGRIWNSIVKADGQERVALINAAARAYEANMDVKRTVIQEMMDLKALQQGETIIGPRTDELVQTTAGTVQTMATGRATTNEEVRGQYVEGIRQAFASEEDPGTLKRMTIAKRFYDDARLRRDQAYAAGEHANGQKFDMAMQHIHNEHFAGWGSPDEAMQAQMAQTPDQIVEDALMLQLGGVGGAPARRNPMDMLMGEMRGPRAETPEEVSVGEGLAQPAQVPAEPTMQVPARGQPTAQPGLTFGQYLRTPTETPWIDAEIERKRQELQRLQAMPAPTEADIFRGFERNYMLETPFQRVDPEAQRYIDMFADLPPVERDMVMQEIRASRGRPFRGRAVARGMEEIAGARPAPPIEPVEPGREVELGGMEGWLLENIDTIWNKKDEEDQKIAMDAFAEQLKVLAPHNQWADAMYLAYEQNEGNPEAILTAWDGVINHIEQLQLEEVGAQVGAGVEQEIAGIPGRVESKQRNELAKHISMLEEVATAEAGDQPISQQRLRQIDEARAEALTTWGDHDQITPVSLYRLAYYLRDDALRHGDPAQQEELGRRAEDMQRRAEDAEQTYGRLTDLKEQYRDILGVLAEPDLDPVYAEDYENRRKHVLQAMWEEDRSLARRMAPEALAGPGTERQPVPAQVPVGTEQRPPFGEETAPGELTIE